VAHYGSEVRDILKRNGCYLHRQGKGSHEIWCNPASSKYFAVPTKILSRHTANEILKQAGLQKAF
jgi:predicted RNA binding protein YcfA (HicA-like mRNA interferase family)